MIAIVDNSVVPALFLEDEDSFFAEQIFENESLELHVPSLFNYEFGNLILACVRRGRLSPEEVAMAHEFIYEAGLQVAPAPNFFDIQKIHALTVKHQLSFYDASYLILALEKQGCIVTLDKKLKSAAQAEGVLYTSH